MTREQQLEKDICLLYWRVASLPASQSTQPIWESVKRIVSERNIDIDQDFEVDGIAGDIKTMLDEKQSNKSEDGK